MPQEFPELALKMFQISTIPAFNQVFADRETQATTQADLVGGSPQCDSVDQTCNLALNTYKRMSAPGTGHCWAKKTKEGSAFSTNNRRLPEWKPGCCINCCNPNCRPSKCDLEKNKERMNANFEKLKAHKREQKSKNNSTTTNSGNDGSKSVFDEKGRRLKRNKHGKSVVDSAHLAQQKKKDTDDSPATKDGKEEQSIHLTRD